MLPVSGSCAATRLVHFLHIKKDLVILVVFLVTLTSLAHVSSLINALHEAQNMCPLHFVIHTLINKLLVKLWQQKHGTQRDENSVVFTLEKTTVVMVNGVNSYFNL